MRSWGARIGFTAVLIALAAALATTAGTKRTASAFSGKHIGRAAIAHAGPKISAAHLRSLLRRPPARPVAGVPELCEEEWLCGGSMSPGKVRKAAVAPTRTAQAATAISPPPVVDWAAAIGGQPPDPQIAVSSTHVVVGVVNGVAFYTKDGSSYPSASNFVGATQLFQPIITGSNLSPDSQGHIDSFSDLRAIFDPYRKRFWLATTGAYRATVMGKKGFASLPPKQRRTIIAVAVSYDEDPTHGWNLYWWDAAVGWGGTADPYQPGDMGDYPSIGVNATTVDVTNPVSDGNRSYPHVALYNADQMAAGVGPTIDGWWLYPTATGGFRNPDGTLPGDIVQPTLAHPDPGGSYLVSREGDDGLVVWKVTDLLQPTQTVTGKLLALPTAWTLPANAPQKGAAAGNTIAMSNLLTWPIKSVWRKYLYVVTNDADSSKRGFVRILRLWVSSFPTIPVPPNGGSMQFRIGAGSTSSYGWPVIETNKDYDSVVTYTRTGPSAYAGARYNVWYDGESSLRSGRVLKEGEAPTTQATDAMGNPRPTRWGDLAGASVDFVNGNEASGIWIVHEYAKTGGYYGTWVGKIFGKAYPDYVLTGLNALPRSLRPGGAVRLVASLRNHGDGRAPASTLRVLLVSGKKGNEIVHAVATRPLGPARGGLVHVTAKIPATLAPGRYGVRLLVDPDDRVREYGERNNSSDCGCFVTVSPPPSTSPPPPTTTAPPPTTTAPPPTTTAPPPTTTTAPALPDLVVSRLSTTSFTVSNVGTAPAGAFEVTVTGAGAFTIENLDPGDSRTVRFGSPCRTLRSVTAVADSRNQVAESNERNNSETVSC